MRRIFLLFGIIFLTGCVSAAMDHYSGRYRKVFAEGATIESIRKRVGKPEYTYDSEVDSTSPEYTAENYFSYDVYDVTGKIHKPGDGASQATTSAVSLGIAELILIPFTAVKITAEYLQTHTLVVFYDEQGNFVEHQIFDSEGNRESVSGY